MTRQNLELLVFGRVFAAFHNFSNKMIWQNEQEQKFFVPIIALWKDIDSSTFKEHRFLRNSNLFFHIIESYKYGSLIISII